MHRLMVCLVLVSSLLAAGQEGSGPDVLAKALARYGEARVRNLEREQRNLFYGQDTEHPTMEMHWRSLIDYENRRLLSEDYANGSVVKRTSFVAGTARVLDLATGTVSELPDDEHRFDSILDGDPTWPARGLKNAVYEGRARYLDLVEGEQFAIPGDPDKYLFDAEGRLIASVTLGEAASGGAPTDIKLYQDERQVGGFRFPFLTRGYHLEGNEATLVQEAHLLALEVNQALSEADFDLSSD